MSVLGGVGAYPPFAGVAFLSVFDGIVTEGFVERLTGKVEFLQEHEVLCADE